MKQKKFTVPDAIVKDQLFSLTILHQMNLPRELTEMPHTGARVHGKINLPPSSVMLYIKKNSHQPWIYQLVFSALIAAPQRAPISMNQLIASLNWFYENAWRLHQDILVGNEFFLEEATVNSTFMHILSERFKASDYRKQRTVSNYCAIAGMINAWFKLHEVSLGMDRNFYRVLQLPLPNRFVTATARRISKDLEEQSKRNRKAKTDEVLPSFTYLYRQSKTRLNLFEKFYSSFVQAVATAQKNRLLKMPYSYREGLQEVSCELIHVSCVVEEVRNIDYVVKKDLRRTLFDINFEEINLSAEYFLVKILNSDELNLSTFWFVELCEAGVLYSKSTHNENKMNELFKKYNYPDSYFYTTSLASKLIENLPPRIADIASQHLGNPYVDVHSFRLVFHLAALAMDFFATTGLRINELMQLSASPQCLSVVELTNTDGKSTLLKHTAMLIPKGRDKPEPFFFAEQTFNLLMETATVITEITKFVSGNAIIPTVVPHKRNKKAHLMHPAPYLFQLNGKHLADAELTSAIRFLLHRVPLLKPNRENQFVTFSAHILRHCFSTHAVHIEKIPHDVVARFLNHRDVSTTLYYSAPTASMVAQHQSNFAESISKTINLDAHFANAGTEELKLFNEIKAKSGSMSKVVGGTCLSHGFCPKTDSCIGCPTKAPESSHRDMVARQLAQSKLDYEACLNEGYMAEALRHERLIVSCEKELDAMDFQDSNALDKASIVTITLPKGIAYV